MRIPITLLLLFFSLTLFGQNPYEEFYKDEEGGDQKFYYGNGNVMLSYTLLNHHLEGGYYQFGRKGNELLKIDFTTGMFDGKVQQFYKNGLLKSEETYRKDTLVNSKSFKYYRSGKIKYSFNHSFDLDSITKYPNWQSHKNESVVLKFYLIKYTLEYFFENYASHGVYTEYYRNGNIKFEVTQKNEKFDGVARSYYKSGELEWDYVFVDDKIEGVATKYSKEGLPIKKLDYVLGKKV